MIVGSVVLLLLATVLLVLGFVRGPDDLYYASIGSSALAALSLMAGVRQRSTARADDDDFDTKPGAPPATTVAAHAAPALGSAAVPGEEAGLTQADGPDAPRDDTPPDEPSEQVVSPADLARIAVLGVDVLVVDGRPRYHVGDCLHLLGRDYERLPVGEAVELGFTPCGQCDPVDLLLAEVPPTRPA